jgi:hypothetical protein
MKLSIILISILGPRPMVIKFYSDFECKVHVLMPAPACDTTYTNIKSHFYTSPASYSGWALGCPKP